MSFTLSRIMSAGTAGYAMFALAEPAHLGKAMEAPSSEADGYELLAHTYGVRDLAISSVGILGSPKSVRAAMRIRIMCDVGDGILLALRAPKDEVRTKVLAVTLGWATLNALALRIDSARAGKLVLGA